MGDSLPILPPFYWGVFLQASGKSAGSFGGAGMFYFWLGFDFELFFSPAFLGAAPRYKLRVTCSLSSQ